MQFTSGRTDTYYIPHEAGYSVTIGDYVVVEADRGEDLGRVIMDNISVPLPRRNSTSSMYAPYEQQNGSYDADEGFGGQIPPNSNIPATSNFPKKIYRIAQPIEVESLLVRFLE